MNEIPWANDITPVVHGEVQRCAVSVAGNGAKEKSRTPRAKSASGPPVNRVSLKLPKLDILKFREF